MACYPKVEFRAAQFDMRAFDDLNEIKSDTAADLKAYELGCDRGEMNCIAVYIDGERRGTMIASWHDEGVIIFVCNAIRIEQIEGQSMTEIVFDMCSAWAKANGAQKLRFWTARKGLAVATQAMGFTKMYVMEKELANVGR